MSHQLLISLCTIFVVAVPISTLGACSVIANWRAGISLKRKRLCTKDIVELRGKIARVQKCGRFHVVLKYHDSKFLMIPNRTFLMGDATMPPFAKLSIPIRIPISRDAGAPNITTPKKILLAQQLDASLNPVLPCAIEEISSDGIRLAVHAWTSSPVGTKAEFQSAVLETIWDRLHSEGFSVPFSAPRDPTIH